MNWDATCLNSILKEKTEIEKDYGIKINQTDISCIHCGKPWSFFHLCPGTPAERRSEIEAIKEAWSRPMSFMGAAGWRQELGIELGMSKEEALEKFRLWRETRKTCLRCEGEKYFDCCPIRLVCKEADNVRDAEGDANRSRTFEADGSKALRIELSEARQRASLR